MILGGMNRPQQAFVERDRARAIDAAVAGAGEGDAVLVAGKGHEDYQIVGTERRHFSDRELLGARAGGSA
jgi:UDP-N-acetylmuramoyl-L-alanyl-D-glutamate--2,6-diaminopimelate ligase